MTNNNISGTIKKIKQRGIKKMNARNEIELKVRVAYGEIYVDIDLPNGLIFESDSMDETLLWIDDKYPQYEIKIVSL